MHNSHHPGLGVAQCRGQTGDTAVPCITSLGLGQAPQTLCFCGPACPHALTMPSCFTPPQTLPKLFPTKPACRTHTGVQPRPVVQDCLQWDSTHHFPQPCIFPTQACPVPSPQGHPCPRLWNCSAEEIGWKVPQKSAFSIRVQMRTSGQTRVTKAWRGHGLSRLWAA